MTTWGIVSTILAPAPEILAWAAWHLEAGAQRIHVYLDAENPEAEAALKAHPKTRVTTCDAAYWQNQHGRRPAKHQLRQTANATRCYARETGVDWLIHIDVDEFLVAKEPVGDVLAALPPETLTTRIRPIEALAGDGTAFKAFVPPGRDRARIVERIYPAYGQYVKGGFLSHVAGKPFVRTGLAEMQIKIHQALQAGVALDGDEQNPLIDLAHCHAKSWEQWIAQYRYRLEKGSYRAELGPARPRDKGGLSLHEVFTMIEAEEGEAGLRAFYDEVCADTPRLRAALKAEGLLREVVLPLDSLRAKYFPDTSTV